MSKSSKKNEPIKKGSKFVKGPYTAPRDGDTIFPTPTPPPPPKEGNEQG